jgi:hypothetical protein
MDNDLHTATEPSMASLVGGIINDAQALIKQELALARREVADELQKTREAIIALGIGIAIAVLGGLMLVFMLVYLLSWASSEQIPLWGCFGIVGAALVIVGGGLFCLGKNKAAQIHVVPPQTAATLKENVQWLKNQT